MAAQDCIDRISQAMDGATLDEQVKMAEQADRIIKETTGKSEDEILKHLENTIESESIAKKIEARNKALNYTARRNTEQFVEGFEDSALGFEALLVGVNEVSAGSRRSVAGIQSSMQERYTAGFVADMEELGTANFDAFVSGELDRDIARALWSLDDANALQGMSQDTISIAKVINKWSEKTRIDANENGAFIRKMSGYITRQSHDMDSIRTAGITDWRGYVEPLLDERTFDGVTDRDAFFESVHNNLSTGIFLGDGSVAGFKGSKNVGKSVSQERVLHFKDADSWTNYNNKFGRGLLIDSIMNGMRLSAQNTGLMKVLGPNAVANYDMVMEKALKALKNTDNEKAIALDNARKGRLDNYVKTVTGETNIPASAVGASIGQAVRGLNSLQMLGGAVISSVADVPIGASELRYQGQGFLSSYTVAFKNAGGALGNIAKSILNQKLTVGTIESRRVAAELGVSLDSTSGLFTSRFDPSGEPIAGRVSSAMRTFFRLNGLTLWTDSMRHGNIIGMAQHVGDLSSSSFDKIPAGLQDTLTLFGIQGKEWDLIRSTGAQSMEGVDGKFLTPESIKNIDDSLAAAYLSEKGINPTKIQIKKLKSELEDSFRTYYVDRSQHATIEPDAKTRATMLRDTVPGTISGEFMRSISQFKAFPFAIAQKVWGREVSGKRSKTASAVGMSEVMIASMFFGYMAMSAKDIAKNRTPRNPENPNTWIAAFLQGGAMGIYGDFLFGEAQSRFGGGPIATLAGPTAGNFSSVIDIYSKAVKGDPKAGDDLFRLAYQMAPAAAGMVFPPATALNAAYAKMVTDHLLYYNIMESLSPGYKRRMERRLKKQNDQEILIK